MTTIYKYHDKINEACDLIFSKAFEKDELPDKVEYDIDFWSGNRFYVLRVYIRFETEKLKCYLTFNLKPGVSPQKPYPEIPGLYNVFIFKAVIDSKKEKVLRYEWTHDDEKAGWNLAIKPEDEQFLNSMKGRLKRDSNRILDFLEEQEEGFRSSTSKLETEVMDFPSDDHTFLFDLYRALYLGAIKRGLLLDYSHHGYKVEGMPYNLDFILVKDF